MILFLVACLVFVTDWISKLWVRQNFPPGVSIPLIEDFLYLTWLENSGFFFRSGFPEEIFVHTCQFVGNSLSNSSGE